MVASWVIEEGRFGPRMIVRGPWSAAAFDAARAVAIKELELNHAKGWKGKDLSFLPLLADDIEAIKIIDFTIDNVVAVNELRRLRSLEVNTYCKSELHFSQFPSLEECSIEWRPKARSLFEHRGVKRVFINKWNDGRDLTDFSEMTQLEELSLYSPTRLESVAGIEHLTCLACLDLTLASRLKSLDGIECLVRLQCLKLRTCRKVGDLSHVAALTSLRDLHVINCGDIESIKPLRSLRNLETFLFYESTNVLDGDLSPLKCLPRLNAVAFMERPHYSLTRGDLPA